MIVNENDIIYSLVRLNLNHYGVITNNQSGYVCSTDFAVLRVKNDYFLYYIYYYLQIPKIYQIINTIAESTDSTFPAINLTDFLMIPIQTINYDKQVVIGKFLYFIIYIF